MAELMVVGFDGIGRAREVLHQVQALDDEWTIDLDDAVAAYRTDDGKLRVDQSVQPTSKEGAGWGGLLGVILGSLIVAPFTAGASTAVAATAIGAGAAAFGATGAALGAEDAADWKAAYGIPEDFVTQVGASLQPGQSAIFVLAQTVDPEVVAERFRGYGGTILRTNLSPLQAAEAQRMLEAQRPSYG